MTKSLVVFVAVALAALLALFMTTYNVRFHEVAVKTRYGQTSEQSVIKEPGLHWKMLLADDVTTFDTRLRLVETPQIEIATADQQSVVVKAYLMWRVDAENVLSFAESFETIEGADLDLPADLRTAVATTIGRYGFDDLIGPQGELADAEAMILGQLVHLADLGIEPVSVGISQVLLPTKASTAVLARMEEVRNALAQQERAKGESESVGIVGDANTVASKLLAFANQRAEEIKADANQLAAKYLAQMAVNEPLAIFLVWLDTVEQSLANEVTIFLSDRAAPWHIMNVADITETTDIPQPKRKGPKADATAERPTDVAVDGGS